MLKPSGYRDSDNSSGWQTEDEVSPVATSNISVIARCQNSLAYAEIYFISHYH